MLDGFRTWYLARMTELVPAALRGAFAGPGDSTTIVADSLAPDGRVVVMRRRGGRDQAGEPVDLAAAGAAVPVTGPLTLRLPRGFMLERTITLPLVAEQGLREVLGHEMDRYTPFLAAEVAWSAQVLLRDRANEKLRVLLTVLPRAAIAPLLAALAGRGLVPDRVETADRAGPARTLPLSDVSARGKSRIGLLIGVGLAALVAAVVAVPFLQLQAQSDAIEARIADLQPRADLVSALRRKIAAQANGVTALAAEQARLGDPLGAIAALTRVLPDDTFLMSLALHARQVTIEGQSGGASKLIGALSSDPVIQNAAFSAPVTRNDSGADLFSIRAEVRP